ncbi:MAG: peptidylprolyl isomerase [Planctomycetales bacterium]|nr:peptidylprolyl isomerase [Planctomycetales bacterium]
MATEAHDARDTNDTKQGSTGSLALDRLRRLGFVVGGVAVLIGAVTVRYYWSAPQANAQVPGLGRKAAPTKSAQQSQPQQQAAAPQSSIPAIVALVNAEEITREELAQEALRHYGQEVLESMINKHLISQACRDRGVEISHAEIDEEIGRLAQNFGANRQQWLQLLQRERGITPEQYARDIIWPTLALQKLADSRLEVSQQELDEAYDSEFGEAVKVRLIACNSMEKAQNVLATAQADPAQFGELAKTESDDYVSASCKGLIQPIRRHRGDPGLEEVAFQLQPGQISEIVPVNHQFVILKCEERLPARNLARADVDERLRDAIRDRKLHKVGSDVFAELQAQAKVENVLNNPERSRQLPGVAALVNGNPISIEALAHECVERHGEKLVDGMITRRQIEQALRQGKIEVSQQDIDDEIFRAAATMGKTNEQGEPDVQAWVTFISEEQGIPFELYVHDTVWPTVALKKLVGDHVEVTDEDLRRGYEANYGERVRCRAIFLENHRRAQEVWAEARDNPTVESFGDLAEKNSVEPMSRALRGEVPPVQQHGGQPVLEKEAFSLKPGELSSIIQVGDKYVILYCEGRTEPKNIAMDEVRDYIVADVREKKTRLLMARYLGQMSETAKVHNFLAKAPKVAPGTEGTTERIATRPQKGELPQRR